MGAYLDHPNTEKHVEVGRNDKLEFACGEMQGWRKEMEDACIHETNFADGNSLFAVFDGHGGFEVSIFAKRKLPALLMQNSLYRQRKYVLALQQCFKQMDECICSEAGEQELARIRSQRSKKEKSAGKISEGTGCTANVVLITSTSIITANSGDSRSALYQSNNCIQLSTDHKPEDKTELQRITKAGGKVTNGRVNGGLNLTRAFGDFQYKNNPQLAYHEHMITCKPDIKIVQRGAEDQFVVIGCDGIWERYEQSSLGLLEIIHSDLRQEQSCEAIVRDTLDLLLATQKKNIQGCDNMSMILIRFLK